MAIMQKNQYCRILFYARIYCDDALSLVRSMRTFTISSSHTAIVHQLIEAESRYGDGAGNTAEENVSVFSLIRMR